MPMTESFLSDRYDFEDPESSEKKVFYVNQNYLEEEQLKVPYRAPTDPKVSHKSELQADRTPIAVKFEYIADVNCIRNVNSKSVLQHPRSFGCVACASTQQIEIVNTSCFKKPYRTGDCIYKTFDAAHP